jgi:6-pyruvoyltetrahydropterin/6-carboxytetrahydropterin synthase
MFEITVELEFDAAHYLRGYKGRCERLHGHRYRVSATVSTDKLDKNGLACDFTKIKAKLLGVLSDWDHRCMNELAPFDKLNPSAENIAFRIYSLLAPSFRGRLKLNEVAVWESPGSRAVYKP